MASIDLCPYLNLRARMQFLPGMLDLLLVVGLFFPPFLRLGAALPAQFDRFAALRGKSLVDAILLAPSTAVIAVALFMGFELFKGLPSILGNRLWHYWLVRDGRKILWLCALYPLLILISATDEDYLGFLAAVTMVVSLPAIYQMYGVTRLRRHPHFRHLVRTRREGLGTLVQRYDLLSQRSIATLLRGVATAWRVHLGFMVLAVLAVVKTIAPELGDRVGIEIRSEAIHEVLVFATLMGAVLCMRQLIVRGCIDMLAGIRARLVRSAEAVMAEDGRPKLLFLRSFRADGATVSRRMAWGFRWLFLLRARAVRLEEVIADVLFAYGPLVALHNPSHQDAAPGAAKLPALANDAWQQSVDSLLAKAAMIVFVVGETDGLRWEAMRAIERGLLEKCVLVFPPDHSQASACLLVVNQPELAAALGIHDAQQERKLLRDALLVFWREPGEPTIVRSSGTMALDYEEALRMVASMKYKHFPESQGGE